MLKFNLLVKLLEEENWDRILELVPELRRLDGLWQGTKYHYTDAWTHTKHVVKGVKLLRAKLQGKGVNIDFSPPSESGFFGFAARDQLFDPHVEKWLLSTLSTQTPSGVSLWDIVLVAALFHDIGKPDTAEDVGDGIRVHFIGHPEVGAQLLTDKLQSLAFEEPWNKVIELVKEHFLLLSGFNYNFPEKRYVPDVRLDMAFRAMLLALSIADIISSKSSHRFEEYMEYLGAVAWYWLHFEPILLLKEYFFSTEYHPDKYLYIKKATYRIMDVPESKHNDTLDKIYVERKGRRIKLSREFVKMVEFTAKSPVYVTIREGVKFANFLFEKLPSSRNIFEDRVAKNRKMRIVANALSILKENRLENKCDGCLALAASVLCDTGNVGRASELALLISDVSLMAKVARYCGERKLKDRIRRKSAFYLGWVRGFKKHPDISHWLGLHCDAIQFCVWDQVFQKLLSEITSSPPFTSGKALGELQRLYLKFWECPELRNWISEYSTWTMGHYEVLKHGDKARELCVMLVSSMKYLENTSILQRIARDEQLLAAAIPTIPQVILYVEGKGILRATLSYDIGKKARNLIKQLLESPCGCDSFRLLVEFLGFKQIEIRDRKDLFDVLNYIREDLGLPMILKADKTKGLADMPALLKYCATQCLNELMKLPREGKRINLLKRLTKLLIGPFS